jgi:hypothetical protein
MTEIIQLGYRHYLIQSRTNPDNWYAIDDGQCTCKAAYCGVRCWHLEEVERYESLQLASGTRAGHQS